ncbi:MAG TPA: aspartate aminotransferase family protein [Planctomycetes bacterium]|nr:aspartate aminotransferase family protein [Planctomycetota bacterium]
MALDLKQLLDTRADEIYELHSRHINPQFVKVLRTIKFDRAYTRGEGSYLYDAEGTRFLDLISGYGTFNVGRNHPAVRAAIEQALSLNLPNLVKMDCATLSGFLAEALVERAPEGLDKVFFANSGTETVEAALKFARAATGKPAILHWERAFHGLTMGSLSLNGCSQFREQFEPLLADVRELPFDDLNALEDQLKRGDVAAMVCEPIQGKGVYVPSEGFFPEALRLCERYGALLIMDEVQTGLGRTGTFFASEQFGVTPHVLTISKALSGGAVPVGAVLLRDDVHKKTFSRLDRCIVHGSTFYQNDLAMAAGLATLDVMDEEDLVGNSARMGELLRGRLEQLKEKHSIIRDVRGRGLMLAVEFGASGGFIGKMGRMLRESIEPALFTQAVVMTLLEKHQVLSQTAGHHVDILKFLPTLCLTEADVDWIVTALDQTLSETSVTGTLVKMSTRLGRQTILGR